MRSSLVASAALEIVFCLGSIGSATQEAEAPNDLNRIIRVQPSELAAKIGSGVHWELIWDVALEKSKESGKNVFWYISTIPHTFMDRKVEIDRYMLAGPFSWPPTVERLNRDFIPIRTKPTKEQVERFDLKPYHFVEPGFVIIDADQKVRLRVDHLTTLHPLWIDRLVSGAGPSRAVPTEVESPDRRSMNQAWADYFLDPLASAEISLQEGSGLESEKLLLAGMREFRRGDQRRAKELWQQASQAQPETPAAWKAAAEAEGFGPFVRGFEVYTPLPDAAYRAGIDSMGSAAPRGTYGEPELWQRGVDFLLGMQAANGGVFDSDYDFGGFDSLQNVHCAVTALAGMALLESITRSDSKRHESIQSSIVRAAQFVSDDRNINPLDRDEILWAQAYRVRFLASLVLNKFGDSAVYQEALARAVEGLEQIQLANGGWHHEYANPFVTATALTALHQAQLAGASIDTQKIERGLASLARDRFDNGAYPYSSRSEKGPPGRDSLDASAGRIPICEMALWLWQKISDEQLEIAARLSLERHKFLNVAYKYDNHTSMLAYGGFFFWYDMHARAELIARIKDGPARRTLAAQHRQLILDLPEIDGCFVDSHELGRCYGTAMALLSLAQVQ